MKFGFLPMLLLGASVTCHGAIKSGKIELSKKHLQPGTRLDLSGQWFYKPGYAIGDGEKPESESIDTSYFNVSVPQFLNRIQWWLDDSEDFKKHEDERLKKLGFDTEKAEDGWYRLDVMLPKIPDGRHIFLEFEGVAMKCKVFCNGQLLGHHEGMFSRFSFDLTPALRAGGNQIAVYVSMEKIAPSSLSMGQAVTVNLTASKVKTMSKGMYGPLWPGAKNRDYDLHGIWQPVRLVVRGGGKIDDVWFDPSLEGGMLRVKAHALDAQTFTAKAKWTDDKTGRTLAESEFDPASDFTLSGVAPKPWTPAEPNLYRLQVSLVGADGKIADQWNGKVGFRTFEIRGNQFFLNGHPWWLHGADHLPYGKNPWGTELPHKLIQYLHDAHLNITRTHGTPWNEAWLDAADEIGLGVSIEGIRPWGLSGQIGPTPPDLFQQWLTENQDVVERCRNHPSVFIFTVGNEMMLKDSKNIEKWKQLSDVVKQTRKLNPGRPVIASSEYQRDPEFYRTELKPNGIDDGDADDLHRYNNWYGPSSFVVDAKLETEIKRNGGKRPLMGQEMSTGYPDLDSGLPVSRYTRDLLTPQAWVGPYSYPGSDPAIFLEHDRAVTKRWAEELRFERGTNTAGFMLFAAECWFHHSYDAKSAKPYPVYYAMGQADAPIGLAIETGRRRFYAGEKIDTAIFISNDDIRFRDWRDLKLEVDCPGFGATTTVDVSEILYDKTIRVPVSLVIPQTSKAREKMKLRLRLKHGGEVIGETEDPVEIFSRQREVSASDSTLVLKSLNGLKPGEENRKKIEAGATAILFSPGQGIAKLFPEAVRDSKKVVAEYVDFSPVAGTSLARGLESMDLKWWGRTNDWRTFVASKAERLRENGPARELIRYIPPHGYISADKLPDQHWTVMWELPLGKGRLWVCDLDLAGCVGVDPVAGIFSDNLFRAAADGAFK